MATPIKKGLSAGTMNLKFMTRGSAGDTPVPRLEKKKVIDEGEWDVGPVVRKALGLSEAEASSSAGPSSAITYESSYMPFLTTQGVKGRFSFKDGAKHEQIEAPAPDSPAVDESRPSGSSARPKAISRQQPPKAAPQTKTPTQTAPASSPPDPKSAPTSPSKPATFMRPAGVDAAPSAVANPKKRSSAEDPSSKPRRSDSSLPSSSPANGSQPKTKKKKKSHGSMEVDS